MFSFRRWPIVAFICALLCAATSGADERSQGLLTITFDDGFHSQYELGLPIVREFGLTGTIFIVARTVDEAIGQGGGWFMTWDDVLGFHDAGWEIGSHSHDHLDLTELKPDDAGRDLALAAQKIEASIGVRPVSFTPPFGVYNDHTVDIAMAHHSFHLVSYGWNADGNPVDDLTSRMIGRFTYNNDMDASFVQEKIEQAVENNDWLVLAFHGFTESEPARYEATIETFRKIIGFVSQLEKDGKIEVKTVKDAMATITGKRAD